MPVKPSSLKGTLQGSFEHKISVPLDPDQSGTSVDHRYEEKGSADRRLAEGVGGWESRFGPGRVNRTGQ